MNHSKCICVLGVTVLGLAALNCGGGEETTAIPQSTAAVRPTATTALQQPTATTQSALPQPSATTARPATPTAPPATPIPVATTSAAPRQPQGKLTIALANLGTEDMDPISASGGALALYGAPVYDYATWHAKDGSMIPGVFTRWEQSPDGLTWTFSLRDMKFHNGDPITAADVKFNFERVMTPAATGAGTAQWKTLIATIEATSSKVLTVRMKNPWPLMPIAMAPAEGAAAAIYSKVAFQQSSNAKAFFEQPIGSGPFKLAEHRSGVRYLYEANAEKHPYRERPGYQTLELLNMPEESTRVAMLKTGAANIIAVSPDSVLSLQRSNFSILQVPDVTGVMMRLWGLDNTQGVKSFPTADARVREALDLAINRQEIADTLLGGFASLPPREIVVPGAEGYDPSWKPTPYDPVRAKQQLAQAGYANGFTQKIFNPSIPGNPWTVRAGEAIAGYWAAIGIRPEIVPIDYGAWRAYFREDPHVMALGAYGWLHMTKGVNSLKLLISAFHSKDSLRLVGEPENREVDASLGRALVTTDPEERVRLIRRVSDVAYNLHVSLVIAYTPELYAASREIAGWDPIRIGSAGLSWETVRQK